MSRVALLAEELTGRTDQVGPGGVALRDAAVLDIRTLSMHNTYQSYVREILSVCYQAEVTPMPKYVIERELPEREI